MSYNKVAGLFHAAIGRFAVPHSGQILRVMDFGCGSGALMRELETLGYEVTGCDVEGEYSQMMKAGRRFGVISMHPYRLPFEDGSFDVVVSDQVLEHVSDKNTALSEISRVLKSGGVSLHMFPSKWYLPLEPHIRVPFVSWMWPTIPKWWLTLWAILGCRNEYQRGMAWPAALDDNLRYCKSAIAYVSNAKWKELFERNFGSYLSDPAFLLANSPNQADRQLNKLLPATVVSNFRQQFVVARKTRRAA